MIKRTSNRLASKEGGIFNGRLVNREKPISFTINGAPFKGFEGDTVLSAIIGSGIRSIGKESGNPVGLTPEFCPLVMAVNDSGITMSPVTMNRVPVTDGMKLVYPDFSSERSWNGKDTAPGILGKILAGKSASLNLKPEKNPVLPGFCPATEKPTKAEPDKKFDLIIVGGGVAGLSAARAAIQMGWKIALVEQQPEFGGDAVFFGAIEGEKKPGEFTREILKDIETSDLATLYPDARACSANPDRTRIQQVLQTDTGPTVRMLDLESRYLILATGMLEKLPIFCGNRLPGVTGAKSAFEMASKYGVWMGKETAFASASSVSMKVALAAHDMGVEIKKLADSRSNPKSRFFEFAKAYGLSLATGSQVLFCQKHNHRLKVQLGLSRDPKTVTGDPLAVDSLVICGGWQPNLETWHMAGGEIRWDEELQQIRPACELAGLRLAGACTGARSMSECAASGEEAVYALSGRSAHKSSYFSINPEHESDDGKLPVAPDIKDMPARYLGNTSHLKPAKKDKSKRGWKKIIPGVEQENTKEAASASPCTLGELAARIILGEIPQWHAGDFAREWCMAPVTLNKSSSRSYKKPKQEGFPIAPYLMARFGKDAAIVELDERETANMEVGCLIYPDQETIGKNREIGAIIELNFGPEGKTLACLNRKKTDGLSSAVIRNGTFSIVVSLDSQAKNHGQTWKQGQTWAHGKYDRTKKIPNRQRGG